MIILTLMHRDEPSDANFTPNTISCEHCGENVDAPGACDDCKYLVDGIRYARLEAEKHDRRAMELSRKGDTVRGWERAKFTALAESERALARASDAERRGFRERLNDREEAGQLCDQLEASLHVAREVQAAE